MDATASAFEPNHHSRSLAELDRLWLLYRAAETRNRAREAQTAEQRAKRARYSRQRYARQKGELRWETAPIFQRRSAAAETAPTTSSAMTEQAPPSPALPRPQPTVPVPTLPMAMPTAPVPAMNALVGCPVVMSPVAISQLCNMQLQQRQQQPSSPPQKPASIPPTTATTATAQQQPTFVPPPPRPSSSASSSTSSSRTSASISASPSTASTLPSSSSSGSSSSMRVPPVDGNEDLYANLMVELVTECHVPLEHCGEIIRDVARIMHDQELPELNVRETLSRVEKGRQLLGQREEEREVINILEHHGIRVPCGRLTNGPMIEFLRKQRKRDQAVRIGKKKR